MYECPGLAPVWWVQGGQGETLCMQGGIRHMPGMCSSSLGAFSTRPSSNPEMVQPLCFPHVPWPGPTGVLQRAGVGALAWVPEYRAFHWGALPHGPWSKELEQPLADPTRHPCSARDMVTSSSWAPGPGGLILVPPQCLDREPVTTQSQGGLSWLPGDPGEGQLLTTLGTKSTKRPKRSLSHGNGCRAQPSGPRLRVIIRFLQDH